MIERLLEAERALQVGLLDQAERIYQQAVDADPRNSIAVVGLARVALERGDEERAYSVGLRALEIDGDNQAARRLVDRLVEVRAARGEAPPDITGTPRGGATAVAVAPPAPADAPAPAAPAAPAGPKTKATEAPPAVARAATPPAPLHSRTRDALVEMPQPTAPAPPNPATAPARPTAPAARPAKPVAAVPPREATPASVRPAAAVSAPATVPPAERKAAASAAAATAPKATAEAPAPAARAAASAAPRKSKVTQPAKIRTAGTRRSGATAVTPPKTALPKAKPLMPPSDAAKRPDDLRSDDLRPDDLRADDRRADAPRETPPRTARSAPRAASQPPVRKMRKVEPKQPGLFDRLFRPRR
jgi:hypothetical protein